VRRHRRFVEDIYRIPNGHNRVVRGNEVRDTRCPHPALTVSIPSLDLVA
jgi:hypothetical protein